MLIQNNHVIHPSGQNKTHLQHDEYDITKDAMTFLTFPNPPLMKNKFHNRVCTNEILIIAEYAIVQNEVAAVSFESII